MPTKTPPASITFDYEVPHHLKLTMPLLRKTLRRVQEQLLAHEINGGAKRLMMDTVTQPSKCGMAACIGGWTSLVLLGFEGTKDNGMEHAADQLFNELITLDNLANGNWALHHLFHSYGDTRDFDEPNVAATAIGRYLRGRDPWPDGTMPNILPYTKRAPAKRK